MGFSGTDNATIIIYEPCYSSSVLIHSTLDICKQVGMEKGSSNTVGFISLTITFFSFPSISNDNVNVCNDCCSQQIQLIYHVPVFDYNTILYAIEVSGSMFTELCIGGTRSLNII